MTADEQKAWEELVVETQGNRRVMDTVFTHPWSSAILAADAEFTALRAEVERLHRHDCASAINEVRAENVRLWEVLEWAASEMEMFNRDMAKRIRNRTSALKALDEYRRAEGGEMTADEQKAWDYEWKNVLNYATEYPTGGHMVSSANILAKEAELTGLRAEVERLREAVEWACKEMLKGNRSKEDWAATVIETRRRAKEG